MKSFIATINIFHPNPLEYCQLVLDLIYNMNIDQRCIIQSFDIRALQIVYKKNPKIKLSILVEDDKDLLKGIESLSFIPDIYSPNKEMVTEELLRSCHNKKTRIIA